MNAIDREKLLAWARQNLTHYAYEILKKNVESGAFDIKPHEGRTGQPLRVPGEPKWEDETHD